MNYQGYLQLDKILSAQKPISPHEHDEMLFIIIHQTYELWFKQLLHESAALKESMLQNDHFKSFAGFKRILKILKTLVGQIDILETMTPVSFMSFRSRLENASGFQSWQFRCFEALMGIKNKDRIKHLAESSEEKKTAEKYLHEDSLYDVFLKFLNINGYKIPEDILKRDVTETYEGDARVQDLLLKIYKENKSLSLLCEFFVDLDEGVQEWRYRHIKMVERTIGDKMGTGGSLGARYLKSTLSKPAFTDLWAMRGNL
jgi:tryptophan 2,3-dioxygenase